MACSLILGLVLLSATAVPAPAAEQVTARLPDAFTPVLARFVGDELIPVKGSDGRWHVVYELWLANASPVAASIDRLEVLDGDHPERLLLALEGEVLRGAMRDLAARPVTDRALAANQSKLVLVELVFDSTGAVPKRIVHRLSGTGGGGPASRQPAPISYFSASRALSARKPPVLSPPLQGDGWVAMNGCCSARGAHRAALLPVSGALRDAQRFAIDWIRIDPNGEFTSGDPSRAESHLAYDQPILSVAAGTVVDTMDGLDDQVPGALPDPSTITVENVDGNHVIVDIGDGFHVFYAHLKKGSLRVKPGDRVERGQEIGRLGNTGNTSAPHLHLHVMSGPSALASDGLPFVLDGFDLQGMLDPEQWYAADSDFTTTYRIVPGDGRGPRRAELPLDLRVVGFPPAAR